MDSQLAKSTIFNLLLEKKYIQAEGKVRSVSLEESMSLIGFIPYASTCDPTFIINMNEDVIVTPSLVRFKSNKNPYPLMKHIRFSERGKYKYNRNLRIATIQAQTNINFSNGRFNNIHIDFNKYENTHDPLICNKIIKNYNSYCVGNLEKDDEGFLIYVPDATEFIFTRDNENFLVNEEVNSYTYIADDFLCLCAYINKVTGKPSYSTFPPQDLIKVLENNGKK